MTRFPFHASLSEPFSKSTPALQLFFAFLVTVSVALVPPFSAELQAQKLPAVMPPSTSCPEKWEGPRYFPLQDINTWVGFDPYYDPVFAKRYQDCFFRVVFYTRSACGHYREIYIEEIQFSEGCDRLVNDVANGMVTMDEVINHVVAQLLSHDLMTRGKALNPDDPFDLDQIDCANGGRLYYRIYKGTCGFWAPWGRYRDWKKGENPSALGGNIIVGPDPKWQYRRCGDGYCTDVWRACWISAPDIDYGKRPSMEKIYSSIGKRCLNVHGPNYEMCYYNCADSVEIQQWTQPKGEEFGEITGVREEAIQGWYHYDPGGKELRLYLHWAVPQPFVITLYDVKGQKVLQVEEQAVRADHYITLHLAGMTPGLYLLQVQGATAQFQQTIRIW